MGCSPELAHALDYLGGGDGGMRQRLHQADQGDGGAADEVLRRRRRRRTGKQLEKKHKRNKGQGSWEQIFFRLFLGHVMDFASLLLV